jgi:uncharacterized lipoprotein NlpE involved in copper resistance
MSKKLFFHSILIILLTIGMAACLSNKNAVEPQPSAQREGSPLDMHNSRISVDWEGEYAGVIPAADGPGIYVKIILYKDERYQLQYEYIGRPAGLFTTNGTFTWDDEGGTITLNHAASADVKDFPPYYIVGENMLIQLDMQGKEIKGNLADNYILKKIN